MSPNPPFDQKESAFFTFFACWIILGVSAFLFFHFNRDAKLKKRVFPYFVVGVGVVFASFAGWMADWQPFVVVVMLPMVALISFLNIRGTKFCASCGRTLYRQPLLGSAKFCPFCGSNLEGGEDDV